MFKKPAKGKKVATSKSTPLPQSQSNAVVSRDGSQSQSVQASAIGSTPGTSDTRRLPEPQENPADDNMPGSHTDDEDGEVGEDPLITALKKKLRSIRSAVWDEFERDCKVRNNKKTHEREAVVLGTCHHCKKIVDADSGSGTSRLKNHLKICPKRPQNIEKQQLISTSLKTAGNKALKLANWQYDPAVSREYMVKMIAKHDYPLNMASHFYFRMYCKSLNPAVKIVSRNTTRSDLMKFFKEQKQELQVELDNLTSRCSLTTDMWTAKHTKDGYCCVTCHYIDDEWNLVKKTLAYVLVPSPHTGDVLTECIKTCTLEWNIDRKFLALTADNAAANGVMMRNLIKWLKNKDCLVLDGELFHMRCANHILHLVVLDGMTVAAKFVKSIRDCVKFVKASQARKERFETALAQCKLSGKAVSIDVDTRWNSVFLMLKNAIVLKKGFQRFAVLDPEFDCLPSEDEWQQGVVICKCLEVFNNVSTRFAGMKYPTANLYYNGVYEVNKCIKQWEESGYEYIREMGLKMRDKFNVYWLESNLVMGIGVVLDPRYKARWVEFRYKKLYGTGYAVEYNKFKTKLTALFNEYDSQNSNADEHYFGARSSVSSSSMMDSDNPDEVRDPEYAEFMMENIEFEVQKSELDKYLEEPMLSLGSPKDEYLFEILSWWKLNAPKYPTLAKMARDVLAIPVTSVASESMFSAGGRVLTTHRASLDPELVEALLCLSDWLPDFICEDMENLDINDE